MIEVEVTQAEGSSAQIYAVILIILNVLFFLSIWWNTFAKMYSTIKAKGIKVCSVRASFDVCGFHLFSLG